MNRKMSRTELRKIILENINLLEESANIKLNDYPGILNSIAGFLGRLDLFLKNYQVYTRRPWRSDPRTRKITAPYADLQNQMQGEKDASMIRMCLDSIRREINKNFTGRGKHQELIGLATSIINRISEIESKSM